jgi:hypothetical protein
MDIQIRIRRAGVGAPAGKLADAEVHFGDGVLAGLKLVGFAVWARRDGTGNTVSFPARPFVVHGERRNFALLRAVHDLAAQQSLRQLMLEVYEAEVAERDSAISHASRLASETAEERRTP